MSGNGEQEARNRVAVLTTPSTPGDSDAWERVEDPLASSVGSVGNGDGSINLKRTAEDSSDNAMRRLTKDHDEQHGHLNTDTSHQPGQARERAGGLLTLSLPPVGTTDSSNQYSY